MPALSCVGFEFRSGEFGTDHTQPDGPCRPAAGAMRPRVSVAAAAAAGEGGGPGDTAGPLRAAPREQQRARSEGAAAETHPLLGLLRPASGANSETPRPGCRPGNRSGRRRSAVGAPSLVRVAARALRRPRLRLRTVRNPSARPGPEEAAPAGGRILPGSRGAPSARGPGSRGAPDGCVAGSSAEFTRSQPNHTQPTEVGAAVC